MHTLTGQEKGRTVRLMLREIRHFRIIDNLVDSQHPYALLDSAGEVVRVDKSPKALARFAFWELGAFSVRHDEDLIKAEAL